MCSQCLENLFSFLETIEMKTFIKYSYEHIPSLRIFFIICYLGNVHNWHQICEFAVSEIISPQYCGILS